ncbi:MAG: nucleotidyltransferase domain-containing protein [Leptolyngbya sp. SIO1E4]|nr:nucleotidyltransferase domain-containing protein [Leptolyngbya sp. SIO1E4]
MSEVMYTLAYSTQHPKIDQILQGVIGVFEKVFLGRIRGYYLQGSYGNGNAITNSDLDLYVIFKGNFHDPEEAKKAMSLGQSCAQISSVLLEIKPGAEAALSLALAENAGIALNFKHSTQFLYGEDIRNQISNPTSKDWVQWAMHAPQTALLVTRAAEVLIFPLDYPDVQAEFYGYEHQTIPCADGINRPSSKWLVSTVSWLATALVALKTGQYIGSKQEAVEQYKMSINDEWAPLIEQVYERCRNRWQYLIPTQAADRQQLRSMCQETLEFSNYFLSCYRDFVLRELYEARPKNQILTLKKLARIIYPEDPEIINALKRLQKSDQVMLKQKAHEIEENTRRILG